MTSKLMKKKTVVTVLILLLLTLSLGVATYSWYIVSTAPSIRAVETYMKVIDPVLSIARATDDKTPPEEVSNQDVRNNPDGTHKDKYYDITWGALVDSFGKDELELQFPATLDEDDMTLKTISYAKDGRADKLVELTSGKMGYKVNGEFGDYGIRYYTDPSGKKICAVGLGVWLRINQENHDLVVSVKDATVKNEAGEVVVNSENVKVLARVLDGGYSGDKYIGSTDINPNTDTHTLVIYDKDGGTGSMPANQPILVEIVVLMEGDNGGEVDPDSTKQVGILAKNVSQKLKINIESVTFYENMDVIS